MFGTKYSNPKIPLALTLAFGDSWCAYTLTYAVALISSWWCVDDYKHRAKNRGPLAPTLSGLFCSYYNSSSVTVMTRWNQLISQWMATMVITSEELCRENRWDCESLFQLCRKILNRVIRQAVRRFHPGRVAIFIINLKSMELSQAFTRWT